MHIQTVNSSEYGNTSFQSIRSVKASGLYKKQPLIVSSLIDSFESNAAAMDFCKKHDVDIVFTAFKQGLNGVESSLHIFYDKPASGIKKLMNYLFGTRPSVPVTGWGSSYNVEEGLLAATKDLINNMSSKTTGILDGQIHYAEKLIQEELIEKSNTKAAILPDVKKNSLKTDKERLNKSIEDLISRSK